MTNFGAPRAQPQLLAIVNAVFGTWVLLIEILRRRREGKRCMLAGNGF